MSSHGRTRLPTNITPRFPTAPSLKLDLPLFFTSAGRVIDWSGKNCHGTITGCVLTQGKFGFALYFDGTNDHVDHGDTSKLLMQSYASAEVWASKHQDSNDPDPFFYRADSFNFGFDSTGNQLMIDFDWQGDYEGSTGTALDLNTWVWYGVVFRPPAEKINWFRNGVLFDSNISTYNFNGGVNTFYLGYNDIYGCHFKITMSRIRLYDKTLSESHMKRRYEQTWYDYARGS